MVNTLERETVKKNAIKETLLTPRFYTTDFEAAANMDLSLQEEELDALITEMENDYNRYHFTRDEEFETSWDHIQGETREAFIDFLERSCTSEFSGFILFKELSRRLKDKSPKLSKIFHLMARDEARHAGFLNKSMSDFHISLDLGYLTKNREYTFFKPEWIIYAVYLSEKIGYWRYITIFRHLEKHPEDQFYPLFKMFDSWCQDENRHGDIFNALLRSQKGMWNNWQAKLWSRFFLLSVFVTHSLTVHERSEFYRSVGLDPTEFDHEVIRQTNNTSARSFPVILNVDHPQFFVGIKSCSDRNIELKKIDESNAPNFIKTLKKLPVKIGIGLDFLKLYLIKPIEAEPLRGTVR